MPVMPTQARLEILTRLLAFMTAVVLISFIGVKQAKSLTEREALEHVSKIGPILNTSALPKVREILEPIVEKLSVEQASRLNGISVNSSAFHLIDSPVINAFAIVARENGQTGSKSLVFITTGLLQKFLLNDVHYTFKNSIEQISGIIAHEFGHSTDKLDASTSIENHYQRSGSQAIELRADREAMVLLKKIGIRASALHDALQRLAKYKVRQPNPLEIAFSTHPDDELRLLFQRLPLTMLRLKEGAGDIAPLNISDNDTKTAIEELVAHKSHKRFVDYVPPKTAAEAVERIEMLLRDQERPLSKVEQIKALGLTLWLDQYFEAEERVSKSSEKLRVRFAFALIQPAQIFDPKIGRMRRGIRAEEFLLQSSAAIEATLKHQLPNHGLNDFRPHALRMESFQLLPRDVQIREFDVDLKDEQEKFSRDSWVLEKSEKTVGAYIDAVGQELKDLKTVMSVEDVYEAWIRTPADYKTLELQHDAHLREELLRFSEALKAFEVLSEETHRTSVNGLRTLRLLEQMAAAARKRVVELRTRYRTTDALHGEKYELYLKLMTIEASFRKAIFQLSAANFNQGDRLTNFKRLFPDRGESLALFERKLAAEVWEHRGYFAFHELFENSGSGIDWEKIGRILELGLNSDALYGKVRNGLRNFLESKEKRDPRLGVSASLAIMDSAKYWNSEIWVKTHKLPAWYSIEVNRHIKAAAGDSSAPESTFWERIMVLNARLLGASKFRNPQMLQIEFTQALHAAAAADRQSLTSYFGLEKLNAAAIAQVFGIDMEAGEHEQLVENLAKRYDVNLQRSYLDWLKGIRLSKNTRQTALHRIFLDSHSALKDHDDAFRTAESSTVLIRRGIGSHDWLMGSEQVELAKDVYAELKANDLVKDIPDLFRVLIEDVADKYPFANYRYSEGLNNLWDVYKAEVAEAFAKQSPSDFFETLKRYIKILHNPTHKDSWKGTRQDLITNTEKFTDYLWNFIERSNWSAKQKYVIFVLMTNHKTSPRSDRYFLKHIRPLLDESTRDQTLRRTLEQNRIYANELRVELARQQIIYQFEQAKTTPPNNREMFEAMEDFERMAPTDSQVRDQVLEELAWRLSLKGPELRAYIEDKKSTNWMKQDARLVMLASSLTNLIAGLGLGDRLNLLDIVLRHRQNTEIPSWIYERLLAASLREAELAKELKDKTPDDKLKWAKEAAYRNKTHLERFLNSTTPMQRLPVIELFLASRDFDLLRRGNIVELLLEKSLGFKAGTAERIALDSYISIIPEYERALTLGYLLAQSETKSTYGKSNGSLKALLEVFPPVGPKFGQIGVTLNIFGPEYAEELNDLKDKTAPMSKSEIEKAIYDALAPSEKHFKIQISEVKGSASVKTVAIGTLDTGDGVVREVAYQVQRPFIEQQIKTNIDLGRRWLAEIKRRSKQVTSPLFNPLVDALETQFVPEVDFRIEAAATTRVGELVSEAAKSLEQKGNWSVLVPKVDLGISPKNNLFVTEVIHGVTLKTAFRDGLLTPEQRAQVGKLVVTLSLRMLFRYGYFDPDRHIGNWMVDLRNPNNPRLYLIDVGQITDYHSTRNPLKWDARVTIGQFLRAIKNGDAEGIVKNAIKMTDGADAESERRAITEVGNVLLNPGKLSQKDLITEVVSALYGSGLKIRTEFTFGATKGLLMIIGENYVPQEILVDVLKSEITRLLALKAPALLIESARSRREPTPKVVNAQPAIVAPLIERSCESMFRPTN